MVSLNVDVNIDWMVTATTATPSTNSTSVNEQPISAKPLVH